MDLTVGLGTPSPGKARRATRRWMARSCGPPGTSSATRRRSSLRAGRRPRRPGTG